MDRPWANSEIAAGAVRLSAGFAVAAAHDADAMAAAAAGEAVGPIMAELLESIHHQDDAIVLEIALKADMVSFAAEIMSAWDFQHQSKSVLGGIYRQMLRTGEWIVLCMCAAGC